MGTSLTPAGPPPPIVPTPLDRMDPAGMGRPPQEGVSLARIVQALKRFRWLIVVLTALGLTGGYLATRYIAPEYTVTATIWIETPTSNREGTPIQGQELLQPQAYVELLRAYKVLDPVIRERKLYLSAARGADSALFRGFDLGDRFLPGTYELEVDREGRRYTLTHQGRLVNETGAIGDSVGRRLGFRWVPRPGREYFGRTVAFQVLTPREASMRLNERITAVLRQNNFLWLQLTGPDPEDAAETMNMVIRRFVDEAAQQKREKLTLLARVLDSQVTEQAERLKAAEQQFESYRVGTVTLPREEIPVAAGLQFTQPTVYTQFFQMRTQRDELRRDREAIEEVLEQARGGALAVDAFITIPSVRTAPDLQRILTELSAAEAELRSLLNRYTEDFPAVRDMRERINTIRTEALPLYARALASRLRDQEGDLSRRIDVASRELREIPSRAQNEARLRREVDQADLLYRSLESSRQQARLAEASAIPDVRVLDEAVAPTQPSRNTAGRLIFLGFAMGLGLGLALAILLDHLDKRVRYPDQVSKGLGLPILGTIPQIRKSGGAPASTEEAAQFIEAFRSVRLSITHAFEQGQSIALAVSSPAPGDGKSLVSSNLALSFAEAGYSTILLDGDIRRGRLHRDFAVERQPGLLDHLAGEIDVSAIYRPTSHPRLMLIPSGTRRREGPELLGSSRMHDLMSVLRGRFDVIIFDTPPLGAGIDPFVLATATGNLAIVLRAGETDRQLAEAKLQVVDRLPVRLLGAILNDVRVGEGAYKYYSYSYGYVAADENGSGSKAAITAGR